MISDDALIEAIRARHPAARLRSRRRLRGQPGGSGAPFERVRFVVDGRQQVAVLKPPGGAALLRGSGDGRTYHVRFSADDGRGGVCTGSVAVCVPRDQGGAGCIDQGPLVDSLVCPAGASAGNSKRARD